MNEMDELLAFREIAESNRVDVENKIKEIETLCKIANVDVISNVIYQDYIAKLHEFYDELNFLDRRIAEIERESIESRVRASIGSDNVEEVLEFVL